MLFNLFKRKNQDTSQSSLEKKISASLEKDRNQRLSSHRSSPINYRIELTDNLKSDHQVLLNFYMEILDAAKNRDFSELSIKLDKFKDAFKAHLAEEFKDLYVFVEHYARRHSPGDKESIREFRNEMNIIGGTVVGVINKYDNNNVTGQTVERFIEEFGNLEHVLTDRLNREETLLYPMYDDYGLRFGSRDSMIQ